MAVLAQINIAKMLAPIDLPSMADFAAQIDTVNERAETSPGFHWRLKGDNGSATELSASAPWGPDYLVNMSVWQSIESLKTFVYKQNNHRDAFVARKQWFEKMDKPHLAMWWLQDGEIPTLQDAKRRLDHLHEFGETPYAFTFKSDYSEQQCVAPDWHVRTLLRFADDALIHAQQISQWCGHGPVLEEDMALANVALDYLGQTRAIYAHIGKIEGRSRDENDIAYWRNDDEFYNSALVELPNSSHFGERDYAMTIAKLFLHATWMQCLLPVLRRSSDATLAAVAAKAIKENQYHVEHASQWVCRFGDGTAESRARIENALKLLWPYTNEWFVDDAYSHAAANGQHGDSVGPLVDIVPSALQELWLARIDAVLTQATLSRPVNSAFLSTGKNGIHTETFSYLINEMQSIARQHPGAQW